MRSNFGSAFGAALISLVILLSLSGSASASTHAELRKALLQTEKEIPGGGRWTIRIITDYDLLSAKGLISKIKYVLGIGPHLDKKLTAKFQHDFSNLIGDSESSKATTELIYNDLAGKPRCKTGVGLRLAIWEFKTVTKAQQFMSALNRLSQEAMIYGRKEYDEFKNKMDAAERENAANCPKKSANWYGYRHSKMYSPHYYHTLAQSSAGLGAESVIYKNSWAADYYLTVYKDWKCVSHTRTGGETGVYWFIGFIQKGRRVLVFDSNSGPNRYPYVKEVIDQKIDGKPFRLRNDIFPACPYPQGDVTSIIGAAYEKMIHGSITTPIMPVKERLVISIIDAEGEEVEADPRGSGEWQEVTKDSLRKQHLILQTNAKVITGFASTALIDFSKRGLVRVKELTNYSVGEFLITDEGITAHTNMKVGEVHVQVDRKYKAIDFTVSSPTCTASVRGTDFTMSHKESPMQSTITVYSGKVEVTPKLFSKPARILTAGQRITVDDNSFGDLEVIEPKDTDKPGTSGQSTHTGTQPSQTGSGGTGSGTVSGGGSTQGTARLLTASSDRDLVGRNETFRGNGKYDAVFQAQFSAPNRTVTAVEVSNTNGLRSVWDTRPNNRLWLGGVVVGGRTMNRPDGSVNFKLGSGQNTLDFFVEDNGSIRGGKTNYRMTIFFASGEPLIMDVTSEGGGAGSSNSNTSGVIKIESATYGANCGVAKGNVTAHIAKQCDGKTKCRYVVNHKIIGDPAYGCAKTYIVRYRCGNNPRVFDRALSAEAGWGIRRCCWSALAARTDIKQR